MADVFKHMNELNIKMQGISENILTCSDKLHGFQQKLLLWQNDSKLGSLKMFPRSYKNQKNVEKGLRVKFSQRTLKVYYSINMTNTFSQLTLNNMKELPVRI